MTATRCLRPDQGRVVVLGAGPAGLSAALWLKHLGFSPLVIEASRQLGGMQQLNFLRNDWVLGQWGLTGPQLSEKFAEHMSAENIPIERSCSLVSIKRDRLHVFVVTWRKWNGAICSATCRALVIATGLRYRASEVLEAIPGFVDLQASDVAYGPYAFLEMERLSGKTVLIVGCGDNAFENAVFLLNIGARVALVCRSQPRAQARLRKALQCFASQCRFFTQARINHFRRADDGIEVALSHAAKSETLQVQKIHVLAGYAPNTDFLEKTLAPSLGRPDCNAAGYLKVDEWGRTSIPGIYAAGDVCNPDFPNVVSAIALGAKVAKAVEIDSRNAS